MHQLPFIDLCKSTLPVSADNFPIVYITSTLYTAVGTIHVHYCRYNTRTLLPEQYTYTTAGKIHVHYCRYNTRTLLPTSNTVEVELLEADLKISIKGNCSILLVVYIVVLRCTVTLTSKLEPFWVLLKLISLMDASQEDLCTLLGGFRDHQPTQLPNLKWRRFYFKSDMEINFECNQKYVLTRRAFVCKYKILLKYNVAKYGIRVIKVVSDLFNFVLLS
jgi:hypothetical protein